MLSITVPPLEYCDAKNEFHTLPGAVLQLEHSLISLSKWESKWKKSFISAKEFTVEQMVDYIRCMTINKISDDSIYNRLTAQNIKDIRAYIDDQKTATTIRRDDTPKSRNKIITSEQIYGWMVGYGIPFDPCEKWHLSRLLMLIEVCSVQQAPPKKRSAKEQGAWMRAQHAARKKGGR